MRNRADIGVIGLGVMGRNMVLNLNDKGHAVVVFNRTSKKVADFLAGPAFGRPGIFGSTTLEQFIESLKDPKRILLMIKPGEAVDELIGLIEPKLKKGDVIIDGGNSRFTDTGRRYERLEGKGIGFIGLGIAGGGDGSRKGPAFMPGGSESAWKAVEGIFTSIAARAPSGVPCSAWMGSGGAGHFAKMAYNGIEYAEMEIIAEAYHLLKDLLRLSHDEMRTVFASYNRSEAASYLLEITSDIIGVRDEDGTPILEKILDVAGQKGTGKWAGIEALELGIPAGALSEAVFARFLSAMKDDRISASVVLNGPKKPYSYDKSDFIEDTRKTIVCSRIVAYTQGFMLLKEAAKAYGWKTDRSSMALAWGGGCVLRSKFLDEIAASFGRNPELPCLILDGTFKSYIDQYQLAWRWVVGKAAEHGIPIPAISSALSFYDGYRSPWLPANLIQAQRDYFGAHAYERIDKPRGETFHTDWKGNGGSKPVG